MRSSVEPAQVDITRDDGNVLIAVCGSLDFTNFGVFHTELRNASESAENITIDLLEANFIDSAVLEDLARAGKIMMQRGKQVKVLCLENSHPLEVLRISMIDRMVAVEVVPPAGE